MGAGFCSLYHEIHYIEVHYIEVWVYIGKYVCTMHIYTKSEKKKKNQFFEIFEWLPSEMLKSTFIFTFIIHIITEKKNIWMWVFKNTQFFSTLFLCWLEKFPWKLGILSWNMHCHHAGFEIGFVCFMTLKKNSVHR